MRYAGLAFRAHVPIFADDPLSGEGARLYGGRFNEPDTLALYLATTDEGAIIEISHGFDRKFDPVTLCTYEVDCEDICDISTGAGRRAAGVKLGDLKCAWRTLRGEGQPVPSWQVADRLVSEGYAGILVQSFAERAKPRHKNLVLWRWTKRRPYRVRVFDPEDRLGAVRRRQAAND